jgi:hypothetical protein
MPKRISWVLCLLSGVIFSGLPAKASTTMTPTASDKQLIAQQGIAEILPKIVAQQPASAQTTLTIEDLPSGFTELPPELAAELASRLTVLAQQMGQGNLNPENFFAFVNPENFQLVLGFTNKLPNQSEQTSFDDNLQKLQQPEVQQMMRTQVREQLKAYGDVKVTDYKALPGLNDVANASTGMTLELELQGQPLRIDFAAFRRNAVGAFTGVIYANGTQPAIAVGDVARKLDGRIVQLSAKPNHSPLATLR